MARLDRHGAGVGGVGVLGDSTDSDSSCGVYTASGTGRSNAFRRLIGCNFDRAGLSHSRARGVLKYIVNKSPPIPSIVQLDLIGSRRCLLYDSTSLPLLSR